MKNTTINQIAKIAKTSIRMIKIDLQESWEYNKESYLLTRSDWTTACEDETLVFIKLLMSHVEGSYSFSSLAHAIRQNKKISYKAI